MDELGEFDQSLYADSKVAAGIINHALANSVSNKTLLAAANLIAGKSGRSLSTAGTSAKNSGLESIANILHQLGLELKVIPKVGDQYRYGLDIERTDKQFSAHFCNWPDLGTFTASNVDDLNYACAEALKNHLAKLISQGSELPDPVPGSIYSIVVSSDEVQLMASMIMR